jgi:hypothetical protein
MAFKNRYLIEEAFTDHLKKNWGKYAAGVAGLAGAGYLAHEHPELMDKVKDLVHKDRTETVPSSTHNSTPNADTTPAAPQVIVPEGGFATGGDNDSSSPSGVNSMVNQSIENDQNIKHFDVVNRLLHKDIVNAANEPREISQPTGINYNQPLPSGQFGTNPQEMGQMGDNFLKHIEQDKIRQELLARQQRGIFDDNIESIKKWGSEVTNEGLQKTGELANQGLQKATEIIAPVGQKINSLVDKFHQWQIDQTRPEALAMNPAHVNQIENQANAEYIANAQAEAKTQLDKILQQSLETAKQNGFDPGMVPDTRDFEYLQVGHEKGVLTPEEEAIRQIWLRRGIMPASYGEIK